MIIVIFIIILLLLLPIIYCICNYFSQKQNKYDNYKNKNEKEYDYILNWLYNFSNNNDINFSIAYGTLLGYVRNNNYIPYDNDMDIYIGKDDAYKIISLINNKNIIYNSDVKTINNHDLYLIINKNHDEKIDNRDRYNCNGNKVNKQCDDCSFNGLFARIIYNKVHCDLFVYSDNNVNDDYNKDCNNMGCVYVSTSKGKSTFPNTKTVKINNINTKIFESDNLIKNLMVSKYGSNFMKPNHEYNNGRWVKIP